jgi:hypothetical protein
MELQVMSRLVVTLTWQAILVSDYSRMEFSFSLVELMTQEISDQISLPWEKVLQ